MCWSVSDKRLFFNYYLAADKGNLRRDEEDKQRTLESNKESSKGKMY